MEFLWTAFLIGLLGSFHCVGMCGPIAMALPAGFGSKATLIFSRVLYNAGRIVSYSIMGLLFGMFGKAFVFAGLQQWLSIAAGIVLLILAFYAFNLEGRLLQFKAFSRINHFVKKSLSKLLKINSQSSLLLIGVLNGFLPCGFVYIGLVGATATGSPSYGMLYMAFFGLGTFPLMLGVSILGSVISMKTRRTIKTASPYVLALFAILFIMRGLNLGIPYISPIMNNSTVSCH